MSSKAAKPNVNVAASSSAGANGKLCDATDLGSTSIVQSQTSTVSGGQFPPYQLNEAARANRNADRVPKVPIAAEPDAALNKKRDPKQVPVTRSRGK
jgi:hypothetical protein